MLSPYTDDLSSKSTVTSCFYRGLDRKIDQQKVALHAAPLQRLYTVRAILLYYTYRKITIIHSAPCMELVVTSIVCEGRGLS